MSIDTLAQAIILLSGVLEYINDDLILNGKIGKVSIVNTSVDNGKPYTLSLDSNEYFDRTK